MRQTMVGLATALALAVSAASASACGYAGCSSPSWNYNYSGFYGNYSAPVAPCPYSGPISCSPTNTGSRLRPTRPAASAW